MTTLGRAGRLRPGRIFRSVADLTTVSLAEDRRLMPVVFELEEIPGGIFEKERVVLDAAAGKADARLLIER
jgi:hypothetical protein